MTLLATERLFWHCGAHTAEPKIDDMSSIPPIPYHQNLPFLCGTWLLGAPRQGKVRLTHRARAVWAAAGYTEA